MVARNNRLKNLLPLIPEVQAAIEELEAGKIVRIGGG
jgi:hypothetical protein